MKREYIAVIVISGLLFLAVLNKKPITQMEQNAFLSQLHPDAKNVFLTFLQQVEASGWTVLITSGYRTWAQQAALHAQNSSNAHPGYSYHNYGLAIDINAQKGGKWLRKASPKQDWINSGIPQIGINLGMRWGGYFGGYYDPVHFDLPLKPTTTLYQLAVNQFGSDPANVEGNQVNLA